MVSFLAHGGSVLSREEGTGAQVSIGQSTLVLLGIKDGAAACKQTANSAHQYIFLFCERLKDLPRERRGLTLGKQIDTSVELRPIIKTPLSNNRGKGKK